MAPAGADLKLAAHNGPISVSEFDGVLDARTINGPLRVALDQVTWQGGGLEASTTNGPLSLEIPRGFAAGTEITARAGHNEWDCSEALCGDLLREIERYRYASRRNVNWNDEPRTLRIGTGATVIRMSTKNGPVSNDEK